MRKLPKATWNEKTKRFLAKGINPDTGKRRSYSGATPEEASQKAADSYGIITPVQADPEKLYGFYANVYLPTVLHRSDNWKSQIGWAMDNYIIPAFGDWKLSEITRSDAQKLFNRLLTKLPKVSSVRRIRIVFSGVMNLAEADDVISKNPVRYVRLPADEESEKKSLTFEQLHTILLASPKRLIPPLMLMMQSLNLGEACAVRRNHIQNGRLKVRRQILQVKGGAIDTDKLKTPQRKRDIPLPKEVEEMILNAEQKSGIWVSSNVDGGYMLPNNVSRELDELLAALDVPRVTAHEFRHTFISLMENELEAPPAIVHALSGKKDKRLTAGYSHTFWNQLVKWNGRFWEKVLEQPSTICVRPEVDTGS